MTLKEQIKGYQEEMLEQIGRLVKYNSVREEALPDKPFGEGPAAALEEALTMAEEMGFKTVNLDNYCGYAEIGHGEEIIGIVGHLDIVPADDGWHYDPFSLTIEGDQVFGRGTTDDKGPVVMAMYAMKIIKDSGIPLNKRIRLIMGCDEECGSECMEYYTKIAEPVTMGFTPDASFPGIYGEKGILHIKAMSKNTKIVSIQGGTVINAVCHHCTTVIPAGEVDADALKAALADTPLVSFDVEESETNSKPTLTIHAEGIAAHASTPKLGINAAGHTMAALKAAGFEDDFVDFYNEHIGTSCDGAGCGLNLSDEYGDLTFNNGTIKMKNGKITATIDIRVPVTFTREFLQKAFKPEIDQEKGSFGMLGYDDPLFFPPDSELVKALEGAYVEVTGDTRNKPAVIGGGTYAKSIPGIIAFGPEQPDMDYRIHNSDEFMLISEMLTATEVYVKAIENMLAL
ncbi:MAG: Sapep family Mn(2+)-dependent dipeptidase [Lachnospiraceae bacterium]|nr:Sapep family Mn(2+)-dependent dipeptidase [Lachnospiraceae bacterium]